MYIRGMRNRFFLWLYNYQAPVEIDWGRLPGDLPPNDVRYYLGILQHVDALLPEAGRTFVLTWHLDAFHEVMKDAIVLLIGDEYQQIPSYQRRVRAIFKNGGVRGEPLSKGLQKPLPLAWRVMVRDARSTMVRAKRWCKRESPRRVVTPMYEIPAGYHSLLPVEPAAIETRPLDVFFAGTPASSGRMGFWRASAETRKMMTCALDRAQAEIPGSHIECMLVSVNDGRLPPEVYTQKLASAKIALAPRGNMEETNRLIEGAKLGCVVISEPLPARWYFRDCPAVILRDWFDLPGIVKNLLANPAKLAVLSARGTRWWESAVAEPAVAKFIAKCITGAGIAHEPSSSP
jgi:hypothetical protein